MAGYMPTPMASPFLETDGRLAEFRAVRHFPALQQACSLRRAEMRKQRGIKSSRSLTTAPAAVSDALFLPSARRPGTGCRAGSPPSGHKRRPRAQTAPCPSPASAFDGGFDEMVSPVELHDEQHHHAEQQQQQQERRRTGPARLAEGVKTVVNSEWWGSTPLTQLHQAIIQDRLSTREQYSLRPSTSPSAASNDSLFAPTGNGPLDSALAKLSHLCIYYDIYRAPRTIMGLVDDAPMEDDVLQRQLVKCLNLRLTHRETEELRKFLDNDGDGTIDGAEFASHFFKIGQRARREKQLRDLRRVEAAKEEARRRAKEEEQEVERLNKLERVPYREADHRSALRKLGEISRVYDSGNFIQAVGMRHFAAYLTPLALKRQILLSFHVKLTREELNAVIDSSGGLTGMDNTTVDGRRFAKFFFALGYEERKRVEEQHKATHARKQRRASQIV